MLSGPCPLTSGWAPFMGQESRGREKSEQGAYSPSFSLPPLLPAAAFEKVGPLCTALSGSGKFCSLSCPFKPGVVTAPPFFLYRLPMGLDLRREGGRDQVVTLVPDITRVDGLVQRTCRG